MTFRRNLLIRFGVSVGVLLIGYFAISSWLLRDAFEDMQEARLMDANRSLDHMVTTSLRIYQERIDTNLRVVRHALDGRLELDSSHLVSYRAEHQRTGEVTETRLPAFVHEAEGRSRILSKDTAFVDDLTDLVGGSVTVFQVFEMGLLRISTSVKRQDGTSGVETFIPAESPVYRNILSAQPYHGRAFVVDRWYLTAYEPLFDSGENVIGAIYVGIDQSSLDELQEAIQVFQDEHIRFACIVDAEGTLIAGPNHRCVLLDLVDGFRSDEGTDSSFIIPTGKQGSTRTLTVKFDGDEESVAYRASITPLAGIEWYAVTAEAVSSLKEALNPVMWTFFLLAGSILIILFGFILTVSSGVARPLNHLTEAVVRISRRDFDAPIPREERVDELQHLSHAVKSMAADLKSSFRHLEIARDRAEAAERSQATFLATMSHEIRTPMNAVLGMTRLLHSTQLSPEQVEYVETIRTSGDILLNLINDILDYSKIESGKLEIVPAPFLVEKCMNDIHDLLLPRARDKGLTFEVQIGESVPEVLTGDVTRIRQILMNLFGNAIKFTESGSVEGRLTAAEAGGNRVELQMVIEDTGVGVPEDQVSRLFQPFRQVGTDTTKRAEGTGLGLTISQKLAEAMDGRIHYEPRHPHGARFTLTVVLPRPQDPDCHLAKATPKRDPIDGSLADRFPMEILVVEDNAVNQRVICATLKKLGYNPAQAMNGKEGVEAVRRNEYDLVLMDVQMPVMDGLEATRAIRKMESEGKRPACIVALSASVMARDREKALSSGMNDFASKPIRLQELTTVIEQAWSRRKTDAFVSRK